MVVAGGAVLGSDVVGVDVMLGTEVVVDGAMVDCGDAWVDSAPSRVNVRAQTWDLEENIIVERTRALKVEHFCCFVFWT